MGVLWELSHPRRIRASGLGQTPETILVRKWGTILFLMAPSPAYTPEPENREDFTSEFDAFYSRFAGLYNLLVKSLPVWRSWLKRVLPYIRGPRVLEASFGTGYLLTQFADRFRSFGIDYNAVMAQTAKRNLQRRGLIASLQQADIYRLPYASHSFDTLLNTMAFSGYPDGIGALSEMARVLKPAGRLVMIDINYPKDRNWLGMALTTFWRASGDIIRDLEILFDETGWEFQDEEIGGFGSVHLYLLQRTDL